MSTQSSTQPTRTTRFRLRAREVSLALVVSVVLGGLLAAALTHRQQRLVLEPASIEPIAVFPDFASTDSVQAKKQMFLDFMELYVDAQNARIERTRGRLLQLAESVSQGIGLTGPERIELAGIAERYRLDSLEGTEAGVLFELLKRVDIVPAPLALAQAANESAWGTSRFALEGNNLFGQWCFDDGCGLVPDRRNTDASHEVRAFESIEAAVRAYFLNLNTHPRYENFRTMRFQMRNQRGDLDALVLAYGLNGYAERGDDYVDELQTIIQQNDLIGKYSG